MEYYAEALPYIGQIDFDFDSYRMLHWQDQMGIHLEPLTDSGVEIGDPYQDVDRNPWKGRSERFTVSLGGEASSYARLEGPDGTSGAELTHVPVADLYMDGVQVVYDKQYRPASDELFPVPFTVEREDDLAVSQTDTLWAGGYEFDVDFAVDTMASVVDTAAVTVTAVDPIDGTEVDIPDDTKIRMRASTVHGWLYVREDEAYVRLGADSTTYGVAHAGKIGFATYASPSPGETFSEVIEAEGPEWEHLGPYCTSPFCYHEKPDGTGRVVVRQPRLTILSQDDRPLADVVEGAPHLMVSKFPVDENLDGSADFDSGYDSDGADPFAFRPQVTGIAPGHTNVKFQVEVFGENGNAYSEIFEMEEGTLEDGRMAYRAKKFIRLVSNAAPENDGNKPYGADYDDGYRGKQTIPVRLDDDVRFSLEVGGDRYIHVYKTLNVGQPASSSGPDAIRQAKLKWHTLDDDDVESAPSLITRRMSEDWAQGGSGSRT